MSLKDDFHIVSNLGNKLWSNKETRETIYGRVLLLEKAKVNLEKLIGL